MEAPVRCHGGMTPEMSWTSHLEADWKREKSATKLTKVEAKINWARLSQEPQSRDLLGTLLPPGGAKGFCPSFQRKNSEVNLEQNEYFIETLILQEILLEE